MILSILIHRSKAETLEHLTAKILIFFNVLLCKHRVAVEKHELIRGDTLINQENKNLIYFVMLKDFFLKEIFFSG